ncbi:MAG TPA: phage head closure protein [Candidatus Rifleibacterium sp.]|nr:phage head closure protein [Candidatus Rifleibacterium sp.]
MKSGKLRKAIEIQTLVRTSDGMGGFSESWSVFRRVYGRQIFGGRDWKAQAATGAGQTESLQRSRWETRFVPGVNSSMRMVVDGRILEIESAYDPSGGKRERLEIICTELQNPGV